VDPAVPGNLVTLAADGTLVDAGTGIVLEQDPLQPTAIRNALATGTAPNTLGVGAVDLQQSRNSAAQAATGIYSHAEGRNTTASGSGSHAEGVGTTASGPGGSHAEGLETTASGYASHAEGLETTASGYASHAGGRLAKAEHDGAYVRADSQNVDFSSIADNEYAVRARGGVRLVTATDGAGVPTKTVTVDTDGVIKYTSDTERNAQLTELRGVNYGAAQSLSAGQQTQARANIGLGSASTLTAGTTGAALVGAATVDAARAELGMASTILPPRILDLATTLPVTTVSTGTGTGGKNADRPVFSPSTGVTADSTQRVRGTINSPYLGFSNNFVNWTARNEFLVFTRMISTNATGIYRIFLGKSTGSAFGMTGYTDYLVGLQIENTIITAGIIANNAQPSLVPFATTVSSSNARTLISSENGVVNWYVNGVLRATATGGPTGEQGGTLSLELENGATASNYATVTWIQYAGWQ
jgi:hypothetical protein